MPTVISPKITDAGLAAAVNADADGIQLKITHIVLGQGQYAPADNAVALVLRKEKVAISGAVSTGSGGFLVSAYLPSYAGAPYNVGEIGFYAGDPDAGGVLFAVHSAPGTTIFQRNTIDWVGQFAMKITRVPAGSVTIEVDPGGALALAIMAQHLGNPHPHTQYIRHFAASAPLLTVDEGPIWHAGFNSLMTWQAFTANGANYTGYASVDIGLLRPDTQPTPRNAWVKTGVTGLPTTMALFHWAKHHGLVLTSGWAAGTLFYKDNGDGTFATADVRAEHIRFWDDARAVLPGQSFGAWLQDAFQGHTHSFKNGRAEGDAGDVTTNGNGHEWEIGTPWVGEMSGYGAPRIATETRGRSTAFAGVIKT